MSMKIFMIIELDHVCHVLGLVRLRGSIAWPDVGGWTLSKRTSGLDLEDSDSDHCKNCVLAITMIYMANMRSSSKEVQSWQGMRYLADKIQFIHICTDDHKEIYDNDDDDDKDDVDDDED